MDVESKRQEGRISFDLVPLSFDNISKLDARNYRGHRCDGTANSVEDDAMKDEILLVIGKTIEDEEESRFVGTTAPFVNRLKNASFSSVTSSNHQNDFQAPNDRENRNTSEPIKQLIKSVTASVNRMNNRYAESKGKPGSYNYHGCVVTGSEFVQKCHIIPHSNAGCHAHIKYLMFTGALPFIYGYSNDKQINMTPQRRVFLNRKKEYDNIVVFSTQYHELLEFSSSGFAFCPTMATLRRLVYLAEREMVKQEKLNSFFEWKCTSILDEWGLKDEIPWTDEAKRAEHWDYIVDGGNDGNVAVKIFQYDPVFYSAPYDVSTGRKGENDTYYKEYCRRQRQRIRVKLDNGEEHETERLPFSYEPPIGPILLAINPFLAMMSCWVMWDVRARQFKENPASGKVDDEPRYLVMEYLFGLIEAPYPSYPRKLKRPSEHLGFELPPHKEMSASHRWAGYTSRTGAGDAPPPTLATSILLSSDHTPYSSHSSLQAPIGDALEQLTHRIEEEVCDLYCSMTDVELEETTRKIQRELEEVDFDWFMKIGKSLDGEGLVEEHSSAAKVLSDLRTTGYQHDQSGRLRELMIKFDIAKEQLIDRGREDLVRQIDFEYVAPQDLEDE